MISQEPLHLATPPLLWRAIIPRLGSDNGSSCIMDRFKHTNISLSTAPRSALNPDWRKQGDTRPTVTHRVRTKCQESRVEYIHMRRARDFYGHFAGLSVRVSTGPRRTQQIAVYSAHGPDSTPSLLCSRAECRAPNHHSVRFEPCEAVMEIRSVRVRTWLGEAEAPARYAPGRPLRPLYQWRRGSLRARSPEQSSGTPSRAISTRAPDLSRARP